jgi:hypothetical protein
MCISSPLSTNQPLGSRQTALIGATAAARPKRQPLGGGLHVSGERAPETDLGDRGRVIQTEGRSIRTALLRTHPARSDRAQTPRTCALAHTCSWRKLFNVGAAHLVVESRSWPPKPRGTKRIIARSSHELYRACARRHGLCNGDPNVPLVSVAFEVKMAVVDLYIVSVTAT